MGSNRHRGERCFGTASCYYHYAKNNSVQLILFNITTINRRPILTFLLWEGRNVIMYVLITGKHPFSDILCLCLKWKVKLKNELLELFLNKKNVI